LGVDHQNQLNSVYFAVDNYFFEKYGKLQKIKAEWYEYKTAPIIVTSNSNIYNAVYDNRGTDVGTSYNKSVGHGLLYGYGNTGNISPVFYFATEAWNPLNHILVPATGRITQLPIVFNTNGVNASNYTVPEKTLAKYIYDYKASYIKGKLPVKSISADLFEKTVDTGRTRGYNCWDIDTDDNFDLLSYKDIGRGWWDKARDFGFWNMVFGKNIPKLDDGYYDKDPIYSVKSGDLTGVNAAIAKNLMIAEGDVSDFKAYFNAAKNKKQTTVLFRFAAT